MKTLLAFLLILIFAGCTIRFIAPYCASCYDGDKAMAQTLETTAGSRCLLSKPAFDSSQYLAGWNAIATMRQQYQPIPKEVLTLDQLTHIANIYGGIESDDANGASQASMLRQYGNLHEADSVFKYSESIKDGNPNPPTQDTTK